MEHIRRTLLLGAALLGPLLGAPDARAEEDRAERRVEQLERRVEAQARQIEALQREIGSRPGPAPEPTPGPLVASPPDPTARVPAPPLLPPTSQGRLSRIQAPQDLAAPPSQGGGLRWGGYGTLEFVANSARNSTFDLHRLVLQLDAEITDCIDVTAEIEYEHGGIGGGDRDGDVEVEQAWFGWHLHDAFTLKIGAPLVPFGRYNAYHDDPLNDFTKRPWTARYFVPTGFAQPGIGARGSVPIGRGVLSYDVLVSAGLDDGFTAAGGARGGRQSWSTDNNENKQVWGRVTGTLTSRFLDHVEVGASGTFARYDDAGDNALTGYGIDWLVRKGPFEVQGEYLAYDIERDALDPATAVRGQDGLWVEAAWHFMPCAWQRGRSCIVRDTSHFTLAARYQRMDLDDRRVGADFNDDLEAWTVGLNYRVTERTVLRVDYTWLDARTAADETELTVSFSSAF